ncbi:hypothetical protein [Acinetobacter lwoffii]|uniref:hypothetical protein n=1 Tax=Acinetobacter lwoffii TaxID=28090 RepID=UPI0035BBD89B|nr:hypothetical protein ABEDC_2403 [Acinetobacter lwoffii]
MSTISALAFEIQQTTKFHDIEIKRSYINEIVAALFGFKTFNSLKLSSYPIFKLTKITNDAKRFF